jgi:hypothetical protein
LFCGCLFCLAGMIERCDSIHPQGSCVKRVYVDDPEWGVEGSNQLPFEWAPRYYRCGK